MNRSCTLAGASLALFAFVACGRKAQMIAEVDASVPKESVPSVTALTPMQRVQATKTLSNAMILAHPYMTDKPDDIGIGTLMILAWGEDSMRWSDVGVDQDETSVALVMKDADEERGKRMCAPGSIVQIEVAKTEFGKFNEGLLMTDAGNLIRFEGIGGSGTLVQQNRARFCGVVTGRFDYSNSGGGVGHAVKLVGMFDLPQNRRRGGDSTPSAPATAAAPAMPRPAAKPENLQRLAQCCADLKVEADRDGDKMTGAAVQQCNALRASGSAPEKGLVRGMMAGRPLPLSCSGF